eukprot:scaffold43444_cov36-Phaeocystis_antarctica.AAC.2
MQPRDRPSYTRPSCLPSRLPTTAAGGRSFHSSCSSPGLRCFCVRVGVKVRVKGEWWAVSGER